MRLFHRTPYVPQMEASECGAACLAMILGHWGHHAPLADLREACKVSRDGSSAAHILAAARRYQLQAEAVKAELWQLESLPLPAILHWKFRHFVVLESLAARGVHILDPAGGGRLMSQAELRKGFTGVALVFAPGEGFQTRQRQAFSWRRYLGALRGRLPSLAQLLGASLMLQAIALTLAVSAQVLVDQVILPSYEPWLWSLAAGLLIALVAKVLLTLLRSYLLQGLRNSLDRHLTEAFVGHLVSLPVGFFLQRHAGDLMQRAASNTRIRDLLSTTSVSALLDAFHLLGCTCLMLAYHPALGALVVALSGLQAAVSLAFRGRNRNLMATELAALGQEHTVLVEALRGLETLKASGAQDFVLTRWANRAVKRMNVGLARWRLNQALDHTMAGLQHLGSAAVLLVGGRAVLSGQMTLGAFVAFLALQALFLGPMASLLSVCTELQLIASHFQRLDDVFECAPEASGVRTTGRLEGALQLEGVSFRYNEGSPWILRDINLSIAPGERVALVGRTGAGKSTLARLLLGMHPPSHGTISFDGQDLATLDLGPFRKQMGVVLQDAFLFDDTVRVNLSLRDPGMPMARLRRATRLALIDTVIEHLPQGYETRVGDNADAFSGGERQRLCLARAIALDPAILLLDEATSALDLETELEVHRGLATLGCTQIIIAHRLETVKAADRVLVLAQGTLVDQGTFRELYARPGLFRELAGALEASRA